MVGRCVAWAVLTWCVRRSTAACVLSIRAGHVPGNNAVLCKFVSLHDMYYVVVDCVHSIGCVWVVDHAVSCSLVDVYRLRVHGQQSAGVYVK